ncbi:MAG: translation initiation factor 1 [Barrevirus sp.]|uniref:Translation initiation factor 1 n=1 Tax=Barrevirus sp. TaxID=2487763 RepID=A0A3G4ZPT4_9VIRU|nr:MAG: translation initiation factor 1 [Barrevirus sp.]
MSVPNIGLEKELEIHINIKKRTGRSFLTYVENMDKLDRPENMDIPTYLKKIMKIFKKKFMCGAFLEENIIVLNGDHRQKVKDLLISEKIVLEGQIKVHGF